MPINPPYNFSDIFFCSFVVLFAMFTLTVFQQLLAFI